MRVRFSIDSAIVFPDIENIDIDGEPGYKLPSEPNDEYKYGMLSDDFSVNRGNNFMFASKDGKNYVIAVCVYKDGIAFSAMNLNSLLMEVLNEV